MDRDIFEKLLVTQSLIEELRILRERIIDSELPYHMKEPYKKD